MGAAVASPLGAPRVGAVRGGLATTMLGLALVCLAALMIGTAMGAWRLSPILSGSMAPQLPTGSLLVATPVPLDRVHVGEVIVFNAPVGDHHLMAHRVVRVLAHGPAPIVETKGDANRAADPWDLRLHGTHAWVVQASVPYLGYAAIYAKQALALLLVVALAGGGAWLLLRRVWRRPTPELAPHRSRRARLAR